MVPEGGDDPLAIDTLNSQVLLAPAANKKLFPPNIPVVVVPVVLPSVLAPVELKQLGVTLVPAVDVSCTEFSPTAPFWLLVITIVPDIQ